MTKLTKKLSWTDVELNTLVQLQHDNYPTIVGRIESRFPDLSVQVLGAWYYWKNGWTLWGDPNSIPSLPGVYYDKKKSLERLWVVKAVGGRFECAKHGTECGAWQERDSFGPFTRLMSEEEWNLI